MLVAVLVFLEFQLPCYALTWRSRSLSHWLGATNFSRPLLTNFILTIR